MPFFIIIHGSRVDWSNVDKSTPRASSICSCSPWSWRSEEPDPNLCSAQGATRGSILLEGYTHKVQIAFDNFDNFSVIILNCSKGSKSNHALSNLWSARNLKGLITLMEPFFGLYCNLVQKRFMILLFCRHLKLQTGCCSDFVEIPRYQVISTHHLNK